MANMLRSRVPLLFTAIALVQLKITTTQIAAVYSTILEKSAVEFAAAYINQQSGVDPLYWLRTINASTIVSNENALDNLLNVSGLVAPKLSTKPVYEVIQNIINETHLPTIVAQSALINPTMADGIITWRSIANELLNVIHSLLVHICPAVVMLVESTENVVISLASVFPNKLVLSDNVTVDVVIVQYSPSDNLTHKIEVAITKVRLVINSSSTINTSHCAQNQQQSEGVFILNSPLNDANTALTVMDSPTTMEYRWLLLPHITSYLDDLMTSGPLWPFSTIVEGIQVDSLSTQEFTDFQNHWLSANKMMFPESSYDTTEFAYDVYNAVLTLLNTVSASNYNSSNHNQANTTADNRNTTLVSSLDNTPISHRNYTIWNITETHLVKFGRWTSQSGFQEISDGCQELQTSGMGMNVELEFQNNYTGLHFNIVTIQEIPFVMRNPITGEYEGFCIDLLERLSEMMGFTYTLYEVGDGNFGTQTGNNMWNGIVGEITQLKANLSVAPLTISSDRITSVDFTKPFLELGTSILLYKDLEKGFKLTRFARPFSVQLGIVFVISWIIVGAVAWVTTWLSPYDRRALKREKKIDAPYGFSYSMWAQYGSMMQQGSEYHPLSFASRTIVVAWWFVVLVLISSYTAQLAASLTTEGIAREINSITDLTNQDYIEYGTVNNSEVLQFFISSNITTYRKALPSIRNNLHSTASAAVHQVCIHKGNFAFIWDSVVLDTVVVENSECNLCSSGALFNRKGYGIALALNSIYTADFTIAILQLRESHFLFILRNKWIPTSDGGSCEDFSKLSYDLTNIGDAFVVLAICLLISVIVLVIEILLKYYKINQKVKDRALRWKDQMRKWVKLYYRSKHTVPSDDCRNSRSVVNGFVNERLPTSPSVNVTAATTNGQVNTLNVFVKHKRSLQEEPAAYN